jgi:hypothetical protein
VYVIDGSVTFGLDDREPVVLKAGESFYEPPGRAALRVAQQNRRLAVPAHMLGTTPRRLPGRAESMEFGSLLAVVEILVRRFR